MACPALCQASKVSLLGGGQDGNARQFLAFHPFEEGAACRRDIGEIVRNAGMVECGHGVTAAGDGDELAGLRAFRCVFCSSHSRRVEGLDFESAERAVPDQRFRAGNPGFDAFNRFRQSFCRLVRCTTNNRR